jgi:hypothetical protein
MGSVADQINFAQLPALTPNTFSLPAYMQTAGELDADNAAKRDAVTNRLATLRAVDPATIQAALANGGSMSGRLGFTNPNELGGMSPAELQAVLSRVPSVEHQLNSQIDLVDKLTGHSQNKQMLLHNANADYQAQQGRIGTGMAADTAAEQSNIVRQDTWNQQDTSMKNRQLEFAQTDQRTRDHYAETARHNKADEAHKSAALALEASRTRAVKDAAARSLSGQPSVPGTLNDDGLASQLGLRLQELGAWDPKKPDKPLSLGRVEEDKRPLAFQAYMQREAAKGLPYYTSYEVPEASRPYLGGYAKLILGPGGWHGVYAKDGKNYTTELPVVPYKSGGSNKTGTVGAAGTHVTESVYQ